jgi:hypothetical protein
MFAGQTNAKLSVFDDITVAGASTGAGVRTICR